MKNIVVTGGSGRLGRLVVEMLVAEGESVLSVDVLDWKEAPCPTLVADMTNPGEAYDVLNNAQAVIHLGAINGPQMRPETTTFETNVRSTFNVVEAAAALKLDRIVSASSLFTIGWHEDPNVYWPDYAPIDEAHPVRPYEAYGLSKVVGEEICSAASRRTGISVVSLRITNVIQLGGYHALPWRLPTAEEGVRFTLWPYVDVRDSAISCIQALRAKIKGHEAMFIAAADTRFNAPTELLLRQFAPQVKIRKPMPDRTTVIDCSKAAAMIGYQPKHSWTTQ